MRTLAKSSMQVLHSLALLVARQREVVRERIKVNLRPSCEDDLAIRLQRDCVSFVETDAEEGSGDLAAGTKSRIEAAVGVIAHEGEVLAPAGRVRKSRGEDLAIGLNGDRVSGVLRVEEI